MVPGPIRARLRDLLYFPCPIISWPLLCRRGCFAMQDQGVITIFAGPRTYSGQHDMVYWVEQKVCDGKAIILGRMLVCQAQSNPIHPKILIGVDIKMLANIIVSAGSPRTMSWQVSQCTRSSVCRALHLRRLKNRKNASAAKLVAGDWPRKREPLPQRSPPAKRPPCIAYSWAAQSQLFK
jgi:hypothetical protein